jgi:hypothetical protein
MLCKCVKCVVRISESGSDFKICVDEMECRESLAQEKKTLVLYKIFFTGFGVI